MKSFKTAEIRKLDQVAQDRFGIPGLLLMEHASLGMADILTGLCKSGKETFVILCGKGNNGGDGFALARHLHNRGFSIFLYLMGRIDQIREGSDAALNADIAAKMGLPIHEVENADYLVQELKAGKPDFVVDAILGTGLSSEVRGLLHAVITSLNALELDVTAVDMPSGLNSDTGRPMGVAVRATRTITLAFQKVGLEKEEAAEYCGDLIVSGIGLPRAMIEDPRAFL